MYSRFIVSLFIVAFWVGSGPIATTWAEDAPPVSVKMDIGVTDLANGMMSKYLDDKGMSLVKSVAHQHAVGHHCDGLTVDKARSDEELGKLFADDKFQNLPEAEQQNMQTIVLMGFAAVLGGNYAIAAADHDAFCTAAMEEFMATDTSKEHVILVKQ